MININNNNGYFLFFHYFFKTGKIPVNYNLKNDINKSPFISENILTQYMKRQINKNSIQFINRNKNYIYKSTYTSNKIFISKFHKTSYFNSNTSEQILTTYRSNILYPLKETEVLNPVIFLTTDDSHT